MFSRKAKEHTENKEIKANIDIFYELFRLILSRYAKEKSARTGTSGHGSSYSICLEGDEGRAKRCPCLRATTEE